MDRPIDQVTNSLLFPPGFGDLVATGRGTRWGPGERERAVVRWGQPVRGGEGRGGGGMALAGDLGDEWKGEQWGRKEGQG